MDSKACGILLEALPAIAFAIGLPEEAARNKMALRRGERSGATRIRRLRDRRGFAAEREIAKIGGASNAGSKRRRQSACLPISLIIDPIPTAFDRI